MCVHSFKPFNNGTNDLYCKFCGIIIRTPVKASTMPYNSDKQAEAILPREFSTEANEANEDSIEAMEADLYRSLQDTGINIPNRNEFQYSAANDPEDISSSFEIPG